MRKRPCRRFAWLPTFLLVGCGCGAESQPPASQDASRADAISIATVAETGGAVFLPEDGPTEKEYPELHNLLQVTDRMYSGAEPKTEAAFQQLAKLGVKVIVSVDGARPNVDLAEKYGLRYVHVPIGYDGFREDAVGAFARAAVELDQPAYVHCHHGKHRGPAGVAAICVARGEVTGEQALKILEKAGTSRGYAGLWKDVREFERPADGVALPPLVAVAEVGSLAAAMAQIDRASDNLKLGKDAQWRTPADHPDVSPSQEALLLKEGFRETVRQLMESNDYDDRFLAWMRESEQSAERLESALRTGEAAAIAESFDEVQNACKRCHSDYRN